MFQTVFYWYKGTAQAGRALPDPNQLDLPVYHVMVVHKAEQPALRKLSEAIEAQRAGDPQVYNTIWCIMLQSQCSQTSLDPGHHIMLGMEYPIHAPRFVWGISASPE